MYLKCERLLPLPFPRYALFNREPFFAIINCFKKKKKRIGETSGGTKASNRQTGNKHDEKMKQSLVQRRVNVPKGSRVDEGHCDVAGAVGRRQAFVEVSQSSWMHEGPAFPGRIYRAVIPMESTASALQERGGVGGVKG